MQRSRLFKLFFVISNLWQQFNGHVHYIDVLFINENGNYIAQKAFDNALSYIKATPKLKLSIEPTMVEGNRNDTKKLQESLCSTYSEIKKSGRVPQIIFDAIKTGNASETVKLFTAQLGIPTVTASFDSLKAWKNLPENKKGYLLQFLPPAGILSEIIKPIAIYMNITNLAVLYDGTFIFDQKSNTLLENLTRYHVIEGIADCKKTIHEQIKKLREKDIKNFFILGRIESIKMVLESAPKEFFERDFAWHAITEYKGELMANIESARIMFVRPSPDEISKDRLETLKTTHDLKMEPEIESAFYFDLALKTLLSVKIILQNGSWPPNMKYLTCDEYDGTNSPTHSIDLARAFKDVTEPPAYAPFELSGKGFMKFNVDIMAVTIKQGASVNSIILGNWTAGFNNELRIFAPEEMKKMAAV